MSESIDMPAVSARLRDESEETRFLALCELTMRRGTETIPLLLEAVGDESWRIREEALESICSYPPEEMFGRLETFLRDHENARLRTAAMEAFPRYGTRSTQFLVPLLRDGDEEIRNFVAVILGEIADRAAVEALIDALQDEDENVRHAAAEALGRIGDARAVEPLLKCLEGEFWTQYPAIIALGLIGDPAATPRLLERLDDEMLRQAVIEALGRIGDPEAIPRLVQILAGGEEWLRNDVLAALVRIRERHEREPEVEDGVMRGIRQTLTETDLEEHLVRSLEDADLTVVKNAVIALGWLRQERTVRLLINRLFDYDLEEYVIGSLVAIGQTAVPELVSRLGTEDPRVRAALLRCLGWIEDVQGLRACIPYLRDPVREVRHQAALAMSGAVEEPEIEEALLMLFRSDESELRGILGDVLGRSRSPRLPGQLMQLLKDKSTATRRCALQVLGRLKSPGSVEAIRALLKDPSDAVRAEAYRALASAAPGDHSPELSLEGLRDASPTVRRAAAASIAPGAGEQLERRLMEMLEDPEPEVRIDVLKALRRIGSITWSPALTQAYYRGDKRLRMAILQALSGVEDRRALGFLGERLRQSDPDLKRAALEALGAIGDKRAVPEVILALDDADWPVRNAAIEALAKIGDASCIGAVTARLQDPEDLVKKSAIHALTRLGARDAVYAIMPLIHNPGLQLEVIGALERLGMSDLEAIMTVLRRANTHLKCLLVDLLARLNSDRAASALMELVENEFFTVRARAARALGARGDARAIPMLLQVQRGDPSEEVRREAALALKQLDGAR